MKSAQTILLQTCCLAVGLLFFFSSIPAVYGDNPANVDTYELLWVESEDIAEQTLKLPFLQHMQSGDLQADVYTNFSIQDIYYLVKVTQMLKEMTTKVVTPDIKKFIKETYESYNTYAKGVLAQFNLKVLPDITPIPALQKYLSDYRSFMKEEPIFFVVSLLPCIRLWLWIANELKMSSNNPYYCWREANMYGHPDNQFKVLLDKYLIKDKIKKAQQVFRQQMQNEHNFFSAWLKE